MNVKGCANYGLAPVSSRLLCVRGLGRAGQALRWGWDPRSKRCAAVNLVWRALAGLQTADGSK